MKAANFQSPYWGTDNGNLISECLHICDYHQDLVEGDYAFSPDQHLPLVTFAHRPHDARSSCMVFCPFSGNHRNDADALLALGAPLIFFVADAGWEVWSLRVGGSRLERSLKIHEVKNYFKQRRSDFTPGTIFRAKTWGRATEFRQLDFVDFGLLPLVERDAGGRLGQLFDEMVGHTMRALKLKVGKMSEADAHWLMKANFWLLAAKLLRDKQVPRFTDLDLLRVDEVFAHVAAHYNSKTIPTKGRITALRGAAQIAEDFSSLICISTETLGSLYEEAMVSKETRKLLSVHRTPTYLVDYMLARLRDWIEKDIDIHNCRVFEPACGHAPFLVGAVRMLSDLLPTETASDRAKRREFLRKHISGCDRDDFALEIARLSLTIADIPNSNSWDLDPVADMFVGDYLEQRFAKASIVFVNPPFEREEITAKERLDGDLRFQRNGKAAELVRRLLNSAQPGTIFGIIVPQTILDGVGFRQIRRDLLARCEIREITVFSDKMFSFAEVETAIILARIKPLHRLSASSFMFRRVRDADMVQFAEDYQTTDTIEAENKAITKGKDCRLVVPGLPNVWRALDSHAKFSSIATIGNGFLFFSENDPAYPTGEAKIRLYRT